MIFCYKCTECDNVMEEVHRAGNAPASIMCPNCGANAARDYGSENKVIGDAKIANDNKYPYVSHRWADTDVAKDCRQVEVTLGKRGVKAKLPVIESKAHEANLAAKHGLKRE